MRYTIGQDHLRVSVQLADKDDFQCFLQEQPEDVQAAYISNLKFCSRCASCVPGIELKIMGKEYHNVCVGYGYCCYDPTPQQFQWIERFIGMRREYIQHMT